MANNAIDTHLSMTKRKIMITPNASEYVEKLHFSVLLIGLSNDAELLKMIWSLLNFTYDSHMISRCTYVYLSQRNEIISIQTPVHRYSEQSYF